MAATTLQYIKDAAGLIGEHASGTTTSSGSTTTLIDSKYANSNLATSEFADFFVLIESGACAGEVGRVTPQGLAVATGTLTVADAFTATIASGVSYSLYDGTRLPPTSDSSKRKGWLQILNNALLRTPVEDTLSISGVTSQIHYTIDQSTYPWFTDDTRIIEIQMPVTNADYVPTTLPRTSWEWVADGETLKLRFPGAPFQTGETFTIKVMRPANSRLKIAGTWTDQTTQTAGFTTAAATWISDQAIPDVAVVRPILMALAYEELAAIGAPGQTVEEWREKALSWHARVARMRARRQARDPKQGILMTNPVRVYGRDVTILSLTGRG